MIDNFESSVSEAVTVGIRHIGIAVYSSGKVYKYLLNKGYESSVASEAVKRIVARDYIDDFRAGKKVINTRVGRKQESKSMLTQRLYNEGISSDAVHELISEVPSDRETCRSLFEALFPNVSVIDDYESFILMLLKKAKSRGYSPELAKSVLIDWLND